MRAGCLVLLAAVACLPLGRAGATEPGPLRPHTVLYRVLVKGIGAGDLELRLRADGAPGQYRYESVPHPSTLARLFISAKSRETSRFHLGPDGVVPESYHLDDGGSHKDDIVLGYDWDKARVSGRAAGKPVDLPATSGTQDVMSIRAAILYDLAAGKSQAEYAMIDGDEVKTFVYRSAGRETIKTAQGDYDTLVWVSARKGSDGHDKTWKYWYAPALAYLPVRAVQLEDGRERLLFELRRATLD